MEEAKENTNQIKLDNIVLIKSNFERQPVFVITDSTKINQDLNLKIEHSDLAGDKFAVYLLVDLEIKYEEASLVKVHITYSASLDKTGMKFDPTKLSNFIYINAPAIIFPFVREEIANLTSKAGVGGVLIQPVNFVELNNNRIANLKKASGL